MKLCWLLFIVAALGVLPVHAENVAIFPVDGVNTDRSFADAFGLLFAQKYESISGQSVIGPRASKNALGEDSSYTKAAQKLGVAEYIEISAVGLYVSRTEKHEYLATDGSTQHVIVEVRNKNTDDDNDNDNEDSNNDQRLLDNSKTIVTITRRSAEGQKIYKAELTLLTYGDIEESTERLAIAIFKKITVNEARSLTTITRREGMGHNKLFVEKIKGIKVGGYYPLVQTDKVSGFTAISYNMRMEAEQFFLEFGAGGRIPSAFGDDSKQQYGGMFLEVGGSYLITRGNFATYAGAGVLPHFNFLKNAEMGLAPYIQAGITFPRSSSMRVYFDIRIAQNALPVTTQSTSVFSSFSYEEPQKDKIHYPCEIGMNIGIGW